jgi:hypothetical protein
LVVRGQQFWLRLNRAATTVTFWVDNIVVHLLTKGMRLKTVPSRLAITQLHQLLTEDGHRAGPTELTDSSKSSESAEDQAGKWPPQRGLKRRGVGIEDQFDADAWLRAGSVSPGG